MTNKIEMESAGASTTRKVLFQNRSNTFSQPGGDTIVIENYKRILESKGWQVTIDLSGSANLKDFDIIHIFNFALPTMVEHFGKCAEAAGVPFVVTTLNEDLPSFHTQSHKVADLLIDYTLNREQNIDWLRSQFQQVHHVTPAPSFANHWVAANAKALFTNGSVESKIIAKEYSSSAPIRELSLGFNQPANADINLFQQHYNIKDYVLCVGRFESRKNQLMLLQALENSEIPVVLVSGGFSYQPQYDRAVRSFKRKGMTIIAERLSNEMLASAYAGAKVHALPSWYELPGLVTLEAAFHGANVVASELGTARDYLGDYAFYCDPANESSIRNAVLAAWHSPKSAVLTNHVKQYTWERATDALISEYQAIVRSSKEVPASIATSVSGTVEQLILKGEEAALQRNFEQAQKYFAEAEIQSPNSAKIFRPRAAVFLAEGNTSEALAYFLKALAISQDDPRSLAGLGMCKMLQEKYDEAYSAFTKALTLDPSHLVSIHQLIQCSYHLNKFTDLTSVLETYVTIHPDDHEMRFCLAGSYFKAGNGRRATEENQKVLMLSPNHKGANEIAPLLATASTHASEVKAPESPNETHFQPKGEALTPRFDQQVSDIEDMKRQKKYAEVITCVTAIENEGMIKDGYLDRLRIVKADSLVFTGEIEKGKIIYQSISPSSEHYAQALCGQGALAAFEGTWGIAESLFHEAVKVDSHSDRAYAGLGLCAHIAKDNLRAWEWYKKALDYNPENERAILGVIELGYNLGRLTDVEAAIKGYLDTHPADLNFIYSLAGCYVAQERLGDALQEIEKITLFEPGHERALELKEIVETRRNAPKPAKQSWQ